MYSGTRCSRRHSSVKCSRHRLHHSSVRCSLRHSRLVACLTMCLMPILASATQADAQAPSDPQAYCVNRSGDFYSYFGSWRQRALDPSARVQRHFTGFVIAPDHYQILAGRGVPSRRIIVDAAVAHIDAIHYGTAYWAAALDHPPHYSLFGDWQSMFEAL
jgi:hypothetical protein